MFFSARSAQGGSKAGQNRSQDPLLQETSFSDGKAIVTNQMHCNDLEAYGKKCYYFWFRFKIKFLTRFFYVFLDLVIFAYFNAIFIDVYAVKSFIYIYFVLISMFLRWRILILKIQRLEELNDFYVFI